jgi:hypothetical protein
MRRGRRLDVFVAACMTGASVTIGSPAEPRIRVLRQMRGTDHTVTSITFDYTSGTASRTVRDEETGAVLSEERLPGRPQSSREEFKEAVETISRDKDLSSLLSDGAITEGGFIVDGPPEHPTQHRYIQIRLLTPDRSEVLRVVVFDLTAGAVASASNWFE